MKYLLAIIITVYIPTIGASENDRQKPVFSSMLQIDLPGHYSESIAIGTVDTLKHKSYVLLYTLNTKVIGSKVIPHSLYSKLFFEGRREVENLEKQSAGETSCNHALVTLQTLDKLKKSKKQNYCLNGSTQFAKRQFANWYKKVSAVVFK